MNFRTLLKTLRLSENRILESSLFLSLYSCGKKEFFEILMINFAIRNVF